MCNYEDVVRKVQALLEDNNGWEVKYAKHAEEIFQQSSKIKKTKENFHEWKPLFLYLNLTNAMDSSNPKFSLRYLGQQVARLTVEEEKVFLSSSDSHKNNKDYFDYQGPIIEKAIWGEFNSEAKDFRRFFKEHFERDGKGNAKTNNEERRLESALLTELEKKNSKEKCKGMHGIQPVKINSIARYQMATPLSASNNIHYGSSDKGGGVDILCRVGAGAGTKLCVMELKQKGTLPKDALIQGLAYATFIRALLRSKSGQDWFKIFGFKRVLPKQGLKMHIACAMPSSIKNDYSFANEIIAFDDGTSDKFELHYIYFKEANNIIIDVDTSLNNS